MIYFIHGSDLVRARDKFESLVGALYDKKPDVSLIRLNDENFDPLELNELIKGQGLFEKKYIIALANVSSNKEWKKALLTNLKEISKSENIFVILEGKLDAKSRQKFEKCAEKTQLFELKETKKEEFNRFAIAIALGSRNKKDLWLKFQESIENNVAPEEISGILFWKVKSMLLNKNRNFSEKELCSISKELIDIYHKARRGEHDFYIALERFVLSI